MISKNMSLYNQRSSISSNIIIEHMIKKIGNDINIKYKPDDVDISTMTITCRLDVSFNITNIGKYVELDENGIVEIVPPLPQPIRSLLQKSDVFKRRIKKRFYNQISMYIFTKKDKIVNAKLFSNGSIQMTGCKSVEGIIEAIRKIIEALSRQIGAINYEKNVVEDIIFVSDTNHFSLDKVRDFNIAMINSNFNIGFNINRTKLFDIINENKEIDGSYDPIMHAGVNIRYHGNDRDVSIFVFESGSIVITGAINCKHIYDAYNFINKFLLENYREIVMTEPLSANTIAEYLQKALSL